MDPRRSSATSATLRESRTRAGPALVRRASALGEAARRPGRPSRSRAPRPHRSRAHSPRLLAAPAPAAARMRVCVEAELARERLQRSGRAARGCSGGAVNHARSHTPSSVREHPRGVLVLEHAQHQRERSLAAGPRAATRRAPRPRRGCARRRARVSGSRSSTCSGRGPSVDAAASIDAPDRRARSRERDR